MTMSDKTSNIGNLEEEAIKRKERLKNLKRKVETSRNKQEEPSKTTLPQPKFRSYKPSDEVLKDLVVEAKPGDVESLVKAQLDAGKDTTVIDELDITNLAPRKPDWDLKRDVAKKLEKLERRTQRAIAELIRERLKQADGDVDLATSVAVASDLQSADHDDE